MLILLLAIANAKANEDRERELAKTTATPAATPPTCSECGRAECPGSTVPAEAAWRLCDWMPSPEVA